MTFQQVVMLALQASVLLDRVRIGLHATLHDLQYLIRRPGLLARSLLSMFVIMPIVAVVLVRSFELRPAFEIALVALAIAPVPPLLPGKGSTAGGHAGYALGLMAVVSVLAIAVVPLSLLILGLYVERELQMPPLAIAKVVFTMTLLPLAMGVTLRALAPAVGLAWRGRSRLSRP